MWPWSTNISLRSCSSFAFLADLPSCAPGRQNLSHSSLWWYVRSFFVNVILFLVLFFLTTPVIVVNSIDVVSLTDRVKAMVGH